MVLESISIKTIDNGYILRVDYSLSNTEKFYATPEEIVEVLKNLLLPSEEE